MVYARIPRQSPEEVLITPRVTWGDSSRSLVSTTMQEDCEVRGKNFLSRSVIALGDRAGNRPTLVKPPRRRGEPRET
jgi:hypothetical protein